MDDDRLTDLGPSGGGGYDAALLDHWLDGRVRVDARSRRGLPRSLSPIVKPLPADRCVRHRFAGSVPLGRPVRFSYQDLLNLPARTVVCAIECAGNGRSFFAAQQGQPVPGTPWRLGAIGVAAWRGVPLSAVLERAGITREAMDVMPSGLDPDLVLAGVSYGRTTGTRCGSSCRAGPG